MDDSAALLTAVARGLGFGILRWTLACDELRRGNIVMASQRIIPFRYAYYFVCPDAYATLPKVAELREWLKDQARSFAPPPGTILAP